MNFRKIGSVLVAGCSIFALTACGESASSEASVKDKIISTTKTITDAKQMEAKGTISFQMDQEGFTIPPEQEMAFEMIKNASITYETKSDRTAKKDEVTIGAKFKTGGLSVDFSMPVVMDEKAQAVYFGADSMQTFFGMSGMPAEAFEQLNGKVIKADLKELGSKELEESTKIQKQMQEVIFKALKDVPDNAFKNEKDVYSVTLKDKDLKNIIIKAAEEMSKIDSYPGNIADLKKDIKKADLGKSYISISYTLDGDTIKKQDVTINIDIKNDNKEPIKLKVDVKSDIKSINKPVKFTVDTSEGNVVPMEEFEQMLNEIMMNGATMEQGGAEVTEPAA